MHDLVVRGGTVVDGTGAPARRADVAVRDGLIVAVGEDVGTGRRDIDANGAYVTPGFVDPHTHYDGQATWDPWLAPSSNHGVTSALMGNCGVGFAPVAADRHAWLIETMEGVEDIPGTALHEGLEWDWESFPEFLDALDRRPRTLDVGTQIPHAALRGYVMGERGADPGAGPSAAEIDAMTRLAREGLDAGALGISTSRTEVHRTSRGDNLGTLRSPEAELMGLAAALRGRRSGVFQLVSDAYRTTDDDFSRGELDLIEAVARLSGRPVSFTVQQSLEAPDRWRELLGRAESLAAAGLDVRAQVAPRPIGMLLGLQTTVHPFSYCGPYRRIAGLPPAERVEALRAPALRARILASHAQLTSGDAFAGLAFLGRFDDMFLMDDPVDYDLHSDRSLGVAARRRGLDPAGHVYDTLLERDGTTLVYAPFYNFAGGDLAAVREMITSPAALYGLSDAGAHCGSICDASTTTSYLTLWGRDREDRLPLESIVRALSARPAHYVGWADRGVIEPGYLADLNVLDLDRLGCRAPRMVHDLPAGGRRLLQDSTGYRATVKAGRVTFVEGEATGELPGRLVRGARPAPAR